MRIINQWGTASINLDMANIEVQEESVLYRMAGDNKPYVLGRYETRERARQVFQEIHEKFMGLPFDDEPNVFYMPEG